MALAEARGETPGLDRIRAQRRGSYNHDIAALEHAFSMCCNLQAQSPTGAGGKKANDRIGARLMERKLPKWPQPFKTFQRGVHTTFSVMSVP